MVATSAVGKEEIGGQRGYGDARMSGEAETANGCRCRVIGMNYLKTLPENLHLAHFKSVKSAQSVDQNTVFQAES